MWTSLDKFLVKSEQCPAWFQDGRTMSSASQKQGSGFVWWSPNI